MRLRLVLVTMGVALFVSPSVPADDIPLDRDPEAYLILGMKQVNIKNMIVAAPGCNIGVNCSKILSRRCGSLRTKGASLAEPGQLAAFDAKESKRRGTNTFFQVFRNERLGKPHDPETGGRGHDQQGRDDAKSISHRRRRSRRSFSRDPSLLILDNRRQSCCGI